MRAEHMLGSSSRSRMQMNCWASHLTPGLPPVVLQLIYEDNTHLNRLFGGRTYEVPTPLYELLVLFIPACWINNFRVIQKIKSERLMLSYCHLESFRIHTSFDKKYSSYSYWVSHNLLFYTHLKIGNIFKEVSLCILFYMSLSLVSYSLIRENSKLSFHVVDY